MFVILFLIASIICFTIPGIFLLKKSQIKLSFWENFILSTTSGFILFTLLSYLLLVLKVHFLLLPIIFLIGIITLKRFRLPRKIPFPTKSKLILLFLVFVIGIVGQMLIIAPSGSIRNGDLVFWSSHGHDGLWHIALMEEYNKGYPLQNPVFAGERLVNYHFFSDIALADFNKYFGFSQLDLYFRFFPLIFSILLGGLSFILGSRLGGSFMAGLWASIFTYFAGSFGYILTYMQNKTIGGESIFWASQIQSSIGNPPQIISSVIVLAFLILFLDLLKEKRGFFICMLLASSLIVFKVYAGVVLLLSLALVGLWQLVRERRFQILILFILSTIISLILYLPNTLASNKFLIWEPWWFIRTMIVAPDRLNWLDHELRRQTFIAENNWKRVFQLELTAFLIFVFGNLGMRFLGIAYLIKTIKSIFRNYFNLLFLLIITISFVAPLLLLQKGVASNTIQFFQYALLLMGIAAGIITAQLITKIKSDALKIIISILVVILSIPTQVSLIYGFYNRLPFTKISSVEMAALSFLKNKTNPASIILTPPYNKYLDLKKNIPDIWDWFDTSYVAAFSSRRTYLSDTEQVDIMGYNLEERLKFQGNIFKESPDGLEQKLKEKKINYIYFPIAVKPEADLNKTSLKRVFSNSEIEIWQIP